MADIEKVRGCMRDIQRRMLDMKPLDDIERMDIYQRMALALTLLTNMEAEIERLKAKPMTLKPGSMVRWKLRADWPLMSVGYTFTHEGNAYAQCTWFEEPTCTCGSSFKIQDLVVEQEAARG